MNFKNYTVNGYVLVKRDFIPPSEAVVDNEKKIIYMNPEPYFEYLFRADYQAGMTVDAMIKTSLKKIDEWLDFKVKQVTEKLK